MRSGGIAVRPGVQCKYSPNDAASSIGDDTGLVKEWCSEVVAFKVCGIESYGGKGESANPSTPVSPDSLTNMGSSAASMYMATEGLKVAYVCYLALSSQEPARVTGRETLLPAVLEVVFRVAVVCRMVSLLAHPLRGHFHGRQAILQLLWRKLVMTLSAIKSRNAHTGWTKQAT